MRERLAERVRQFRATARPILSNGTVLAVLLVIVSSGVAAQTTAGVSYDFEQYNVGTTAPGPWTGGVVSSDSFYGNKSLNVADADVAESDEMTMNQTEIWFTGTVKADGISDIALSDGEQLTILVRFYSEGTFILVNGTEAENVTFLQDEVWYDFRVTTNATHTSLDVWESSDPSTDLTLTVEETPPAGVTFASIDTGGSGSQGWYDQLSFNNASDPGIGEDPNATDDSELEIDTRDYLQPNTSSPYTVHFNDSGAWSEVTDSSTVTSNNTSVLTVNAAENLLEGQPGVNTTVNVTASYTSSGGTVFTTTKQITVAQATVDNLEILPAIWRFGATFGDDTIFFLIVATLTSIVATRFSTAFGGLSLYWVVVVLGWFSGWVSVGILMLATVMCMFVGLNLAANINYGAVGSFRAGR